MKVLLFLITFTYLSAQDVYLIIGQSNAAGRGDLPRDPVALSNVSILDTNGNLAPAFPNLNVHSNVRKTTITQGFNLGYTFAETMAANTANDIILVVNARGATAIEDWAPSILADASPLSYFDEAIRRTNQALTNNPESTLKGILWHQGEANRNNPTYLNDLQQLVTDLRAQLGNVPFIAGQLSYDRLENNTFNTNLLTLPNLVAETAVASAENLNTGDLTHFIASSLQTFGQRYATEMLTLQNITPTIPTQNPILFADTFNRPDNTNPNATNTGQSGPLSPLTYTSLTANSITPDIFENALRFIGTDSSVVRDGSLIFLNHNFTDPQILQNNNFSVSVDIANYDTIGNTRQMSIGVGQTLDELNAFDDSRVNRSDTDLLVCYRGTTDSLEVYKNGDLIAGETIVGGLPLAPTTMRVEYFPPDFNAGSTVTYQVFFGENTTPLTSGSFTWDNTNTNYIHLSSNLTLNSSFDNLIIRAGLPEDDYATWSDSYLGHKLTDPDADLDQDGLSNNQERIWGLDPTSSFQLNPIITTTEGTLSYTRRDPALTGLTFIVTTSTDLANWTDDLTATQTPTINDPSGNQTVDITLTNTPTDDKYFVRIEAR